VIKKPKIVGVTGGIGSGKTTVCAFFSELGIPVYNSDYQAKKIMDNPKIIQKIKTIFGEKITDVNQKLDRKKIATIVFNDPKKLQQLNAIVHPIVQQDFEDWLEKHKNYSYIIKEVAIVFETNSEKQYDKIILVTAPEQTRIKRVMERDAINEQEVLQRIKNQLPDSEKITKSDVIIENINLLKTKKYIEKIHKSLKTNCF